MIQSSQGSTALKVIEIVGRPLFLVKGASPQGFSEYDSLHPRLGDQRERDIPRQTEAIVLYNLISKVTCHRLLLDDQSGTV